MGSSRSSESVTWYHRAALLSSVIVVRRRRQDRVIVVARGLWYSPARGKTTAIRTTTTTTTTTTETPLRRRGWRPVTKRSALSRSRRNVRTCWRRCSATRTTSIASTAMRKVRLSDRTGENSDSERGRGALSRNPRAARWNVCFGIDSSISITTQFRDPLQGHCGFMIFAWRAVDALSLSMTPNVTVP